MVKVAVYIDESQSMKHSISIKSIVKTKTEIAQRIWTEAIIPVVKGLSVRVRTVTTRGQSQEHLPMARHQDSDLTRLQFMNDGGNTFLWEFLVEEAKEFATNEDWLVVLITDGDDNGSTGKYNGPDGLKPCIDDIRDMGHQPDFHIIGLDLPPAVAQSKSTLSGASGGIFFNITSSTNLSNIIQEIRQNLEENVGPGREEAIRKKQKAYSGSEAGRSGLGPSVVFRDEDPDYDIGGVVTRYGGGLDSISESQLLEWHKRVLISRSHEIIPNGNKVLLSWSKDPGQRKRTKWSTIALDYRELASKNSDELWKLLNAIEALNLKPKIRMIFIRGGLGVSHPAVDIWLRALEGLGLKVVRLPHSSPPTPLPNPWVDDSISDGGSYKGEASEWNQIPSDISSSCRPFVAVFPVVDRTIFSNRFSDLEEEMHGYCADYEDICFPNHNQYPDSDLEDDKICRELLKNIDMNHFGLILLRTIKLLENCYMSKSITKGLWIHIPPGAIHCGVLKTGQWDAFLDRVQIIIGSGPYPLPVHLNGELLF